MTCDDALDRLHRYHAGRLALPERARFEQHLASCDACRAAARRLEALPRSLTPPDDVWAGIATRINARKVVVAEFGGGARAPRWRRPAFLAAAAAALMILSSVLTLWTIRRTAEPAVVAGGAGAVGEFAALEAQYQSAADEILRAVRRGDVTLSPWTVAVLERNLRIVNDALAESREALARDPANATLRDMVLGTYRQKLELLRRAAAAQL
jgi:anti-sigma factor RsiW